jgi:hypothetical protein
VGISGVEIVCSSLCGVSKKADCVKSDNEFVGRMAGAAPSFAVKVDQGTKSRKVVDPEQKVKALRVISEHLIAGRWADVRGPSEKELKATTVLEFSIDEASSKVRNGPPLDDKSDYELPVWAGVLPLEIKSRPPIPDDKLVEGVTLPDYFRRYDARLAGHSQIREFPIPD